MNTVNSESNGSLMQAMAGKPSITTPVQELTALELYIERTQSQHKHLYDIVVNGLDEKIQRLDNLANKLNADSFVKNMPQAASDGSQLKEGKLSPPLESLSGIMLKLKDLENSNERLINIIQKSLHPEMAKSIYHLEKHI